MTLILNYLKYRERIDSDAQRSRTDGRRQPDVAAFAILDILAERIDAECRFPVIAERTRPAQLVADLRLLGVARGGEYREVRAIDIGRGGAGNG